MAFAKHLDVMIVDDTSVSRALIGAALDKMGIPTHRIARDGEEALKALMARPAHLVLSDYNMPKLDGLGLLKALREFAPTRQFGFILVTGRGEKAVVDQGKKLGLNNIVLKPFTEATIKTAIEGVVGKLV